MLSSERTGERGKLEGTGARKLYLKKIRRPTANSRNLGFTLHSTT